MRYCSFNGCNNKISSGHYCEEHKRSKQSIRKKQKKKSIYHHENKSFYNSDEWQAVADYVYEREHGCCQRCGRFVFGKRAHRHHVISIKKDPTLRLDPNNIRLLCPKCHVIEENEEEDKKQNVFPRYFEAPPTQK